MSELKPCPFCGAGKDCPPEVGDDDFVSCRYCGARASFDRWDDRAAPGLPEGYEVQGTDLICKRLPHDLSLIAFIRAGELVCSNVKSEHWQAVAAFLQGAR